ncbi:Alpha/Beta hydrolase protein [Ephemerocybe angulata]|uniref:Alpha/Beta hydrolase protein n=1 Tax=Ephemerocybe angulata TaxID=980116 RepID=A0A8H6HF18_9AGAR|nr:Alpha/Beta hydrolase protein [Tulosesus angulatus]
MVVVNTILTFLSLLLYAVPCLSVDSPTLAGPIGPHCTQGTKLVGRGIGSNITIADVPTYFTSPTVAPGEGQPKKVLLFYSDVYGAFHTNNQLLQDYFATQGFYVLGIDYFFGDPIQAHDGEVGWNQAAWFQKSRQQAADALPKWIAAVREQYGSDAKYSAAGYCFGGIYAVQAGASDDFVAAAFAHPAELTEDHFNQLKKPLLLSCAETDATFPTPSRNRAADILAKNKARYHLQVFSGTVHGFATRGDPADENALWAMEESRRSIAQWFNRFSK